MGAALRRVLKSLAPGVAFVSIVGGCNALSGIDDLGETAGSSSTSSGGTSSGSTTTPPSNDGGGVVVFDDAGNPIDTGGGDVADTGVAITDSQSGTDTSINPVDTGTPPPLGFCASLSPQPTACTDFDDGTFPGLWSIHASGAASATSTTTTSRSGTRSVYFHLPTGSGTHTYLQRNFTQPTSELVVGFSSRLMELNLGTTQYELATIRLGGPASGAYEIQLELVGGNLNVEEEIPQPVGSPLETDTPVPISWALDTWRRVEMKITFGLNSSTLTITAEGVPTPFTMPVSAHLWLAQPAILINHDTAVPGLKTYFDDIVVNVK